MKKLGARLLLFLGLVNCVQTFARELRTPYIWQQNSIFRDGYYHYPLPRPKEDESCWNYDVWGGGYARYANEAYKDGRDTEPLAALYFGKANFTASDIFAAGTVFENPFLSFATLSPRFDYQEKGAYFGFTLDRGLCCGKWHVGMRARVPVRAIEVENDCCDDFQVDTLEDVCRSGREFINAPNAVDAMSQPAPNQIIEDSYAYRLDFLTALNLTSNNAPTPEPLVKFQDPGSGPSIRINQINVGPVPVNGPDEDDIVSPPVHVIKNAAGDVPQVPFSRINVAFAPVQSPATVTPVNNLNSLPGNGSLAADGDRARFLESTSYSNLQNDKAAQRQLWVVGTSQTTPENDPRGTTNLMNDARAIQTAIQSIIKGIETDIADFFEDQGITFESQRKQGLGDFDIDFYATREFCNWYGQAAFGLRLPSAKRVKDPKKLLCQPLGNNGHYEVRFAGFAGWEPVEWIALSADATYNWVIKRTEKVAASFKGATVKNIGPTVNADVSWQYFTANFDATFLHPCNPQLGFDVGYAPYVKRRDNISFETSTARDLLGNVQPLDETVLEEGTNVVAHKIRAEVFHQWNYFEIFAGWAQVVAGKNVPRETDWHLGAVVYF